MHYVLISGNLYSIIDFTNGTWVTTQDGTYWSIFDPAVILSSVTAPDECDAHCMLNFTSIEDWIASVNSDEDCVRITGYIPTTFTEPYQLSIVHPELFI